MENQTTEEDRAICKDLLEAGVEVQSVYDLLKRPNDYTPAIPILLKWLPQAKSATIKQGIIRALTIKHAGDKTLRALLAEFSRIDNSIPSNSITKWTIGNAVSVIGDIDSAFEEVVTIVKDQKEGKSREMFVVALGNSKMKEAINILLEILASEDNLSGFALMALGMIGEKDTLSSIEKYINHPKTWVRNEAQKAVRKINKRSINK